MSPLGILRYTLAAALFALAVCAVWLLIRRARGQRFTRGDLPALAAVFYIAALVDITALRLGLVAPHWLRGELHWRPMEAMRGIAATGAWPLVYNVAGNLLWFVPLGWIVAAMARRPRAWKALLAGAAVSAAIECTQFLLGTGVTDIDDVLLNAAGALLGYLLWPAARRLLSRMGKK